MTPRPLVRASVLAALLSAALAPAAANAQTPGVPTPEPSNQAVKCAEVPSPAGEIAALRDEYLGGRWDALQTHTRALLNGCRFQPESSDPLLFPGNAPDFKRDWYLVVLATVDASDDPLVLRYVVHTPVPDPYTTVVLDVAATKGTSRLIQVFLAPHPALTLQTRFLATETPNPVAEQIAAVVKSIADPSVVLPLLKGLVSPLKGVAATTVAPVMASVSRVYLPFARGVYKYSDVLRADAVLDADKNLLLRTDFDTLVDTAVKAADAAARSGAPNAATLRIDADLATALGASATTYLGPAGPGVTACAAQSYQASCWPALEAVIQHEKDVFCPDDSTRDYCKSERDELMLIRFKRAAAEPKVVATTASTTISVSPRQHLSFGLVSAYSVAEKAKGDRVKVDGGKLVADPLGRGLNATVLNFHPAFNPAARRMERGERLRAFVGVVVTPNLGLTVGGGFGFLRNLSLNAGYALLLTPALRSGDVLGSAPADGKRLFRSAAAHVAFVGLGYKFGG